MLSIAMDSKWNIANMFGRLDKQDLDELADREGWVELVRR